MNVRLTMKSYRYFLVAWAVWSCCAAELFAEPTASWKTFEKELDSAPAAGSFKQLLRDNSTWRQLVTERNVPVFLEMSAQRDSLQVRLAGFYGLVELAPKSGLEAGLVMALSSESSK